MNQQLQLTKKENRTRKIDMALKAIIIMLFLIVVSSNAVDALSLDDLIASYDFDYELENTLTVTDINDYMLDTDSDSINDTLFFELSTNVASSGTYSFFVDLEDANGLITTKVVRQQNDSGVDINFTERVISTSADGANSVFAIDVDNDSDVDVLSASISDDTIVWYENDGNTPPNWTARNITTSANGARSVFAIDLDNDNDIDVLSASATDDKIAWYENNGSSPPGWIVRNITTSADGARSVFAIDIDGDNDIDVLSASGSDHKITWYENNGSSPPGWTTRIITTSAFEARSVFAIDIDADNDIDVLSASEGAGEITWYENNGSSPPGWTTRIIASADFAEDVFAIDIDNDNDIDVLSASFFDDKIAWYENDGSSPPNWTARTITTSADGAWSVYAIDVDNDNDIDVLSASRNDDKIAWYENDGSTPPSWTTRIITTSADGARSVFAIDIDKDNDVDVLSASAFDDKIAWYEAELSVPIMAISTDLLTPDQNQFNYSIKVYNESGTLVFRKFRQQTNNYANYETGFEILDISDENVNNDLIRINITLNSTKAETHNVTIFLEFNDSSIKSTKEVSFSVGENEIFLDFDNETIKSTHYNGVYVIDVLNIGEKTIDLNVSTASYDFEDFAKTSYFESYADVKIDMDSNGLIDFLEINYTLNIKQTDTYEIESQLFDEFENFVTSISQSESLSVGINIVEILANGSEIYKSKINGPYIIKFASLNDSSGNLVDEVIEPYVLTTPNLTFSEFERPPLPDLNISLSVYYNGSDNLINVTVSNIGIASAFNIFVDVFDNQTYGGQDSRSILNGSNSQTFNFVANNTNNGTIFVAIVDFNNLVDESDEDNNIASNMIVIPELEIVFLDVIYQNNTERVFRFDVNNTLNSTLYNISWSLDTGESNESSQYNVTLQGGEDYFVYAYHDYTTSGNYTVIATASNEQYSASRSIQIEI